ncbi:MAG: hypothetical protein PHQ74_05160 [Crocinitomicaceae bacterium]|nr:hypothetical protein [Crocinitomicaceae bacterium]
MYPDRLLPSLNKSKSFKFTKNCFICRRTDIEKKLMYDEDGELTDITINVKELINCSTNLVNEISVVNSVDTIAEDVLINILGVHKNLSFKEWNEIDEDVPNCSEILYSTETEKGYYFIKICDLNGIKRTFPFSKNQGAVAKDFSLEIEINHRPTMVNLSHFEINAQCDVNGDMAEISRGDFKGYRKEISHIIKEEVRKSWRKEIK